MYTQRTGKRAEDIACSHLQQYGLTLLQRNYTCRYGEIDLVMQDITATVFVEVRYRQRQDHGGALESVDFRKQAKLIKSATAYLKDNGLLDQPARIDVVALSSLDGSEGSLVWVRDAVEG